MTDFHVHFGQFKDAYYYPEKVVQDLATRGIDHAWISSTTSCMYCSELHPEFAGQPAARQIEDSVTDEFRAAISEGSKCGVKIHPLYWLVPDFEKSGVRFEDYLPSVPYEGFKIHPRAQNWDLSDDRIRSLAERAFTFSDEHGLRILIHTGTDEIDSPLRFEEIIKCFPRVTVQLAHLRNLSECIYMMETYANVYCDTACAPSENIDKVRKKDWLQQKLLYGTDFPIYT
jgi:predicted TIM-barrel fold metal-dependent hydrolase